MNRSKIKVLSFHLTEEEKDAVEKVRYITRKPWREFFLDMVEAEEKRLNKLDKSDANDKSRNIS